MTSMKHWIFSALLLAISACAGMTEKQDDGHLARGSSMVDTCDKVAVTGSLIKKRVTCGERVDHESIAAYENWRREHERAQLYREAERLRSGK